MHEAIRFDVSFLVIPFEMDSPKLEMIHFLYTMLNRALFKPFAERGKTRTWHGDYVIQSVNRSIPTNTRSYSTYYGTITE